MQTDARRVSPRRAVATNSDVNPGGGRSYVDIGKNTKRKRSATQVAQELRTLTARLVGAEYVVLDDLSNGAQKPVQIRFTGPDSRRLLEITRQFMAQLRQVPGAVDVGNIERLPIAVSGSNRMVLREQIATVTMGKDPSQIQHADGKRTILVAANALRFIGVIMLMGLVAKNAILLLDAARVQERPPGWTAKRH